MSAPFKVLIIGGGIAGLSLALMLEAYGFEYELLEKHAEIAPKLGAGVGLTPNGARILDQIGVWDLMCELGCPINGGTAISPEGTTLIHNACMGENLKKLFGYKIHFLPRYHCLNVLHGQIRNKSAIHMQKELISVSILGEKVRVRTKDGSVYTGNILIGADGVRSHVRREVWRIADSERPGYISNRDKTAIESSYTAIVGVAHNVPNVPTRASARSYNHQRSYFFQEGREGSKELYWWLCVKNEKKQKGTTRGMTSEAKEALLNKYRSDKVWPGLTLSALRANSAYSTGIPLEEFVLEKCFYKNILLLGDSFRKLHPVAGQGANSAIEESAFFADLLWDLRFKNALHNPARIQQAFSEFQRERHMRLTALRNDAHDVQCLESLDTPVHRLMAMQILPRLSFEKAFLPRLGASFMPARVIKHLPSPKMGMCAFASEMKAKPRERSLLATLSWIALLLLAASAPWRIMNYAPNSVKDNTFMNGPTSPLYHALNLYISVIGASITGLWLIESYCADSLITPFCSATPWILASNHWGWEKVLPIYLSLHIALSKGFYYYYMPRTMTDLGVAKALQTALVLVYTVPIYLSLTNVRGWADYSWSLAHCALPIVAYVCGKILTSIWTIPSGIDVIFSGMDVPSQKHFHHTVQFAASAWHIFFSFRYGPGLFDAGVQLLTWPAVGSLLSLVAVATIWCLYAAWDLERVNAIDTTVVCIWARILLSTVVCGPASTLTGMWMCRATQLTKATSFQRQSQMSNGKLSNGKLRWANLNL